MDRRILTVDWVSRLFSIVGVLGTLGIGLYLYNDSQQTTPDETVAAIQAQVETTFSAEKEQLVTEVTNSVAQSYDARFATLEKTRQDSDYKAQTDLDSAIRQTLTNFESDAKNRLYNWETKALNSLADREDAFDKYIASLPQSNSDDIFAPSDRDNDDTGDSDEDAGSESSADLRVARLALRPSSSRALANGEIRIQNRGTSDATISIVEFFPEKIYEVKEPVEDVSILFDRTRIVFTPADNRATEQDKHKEYVHVLPTPVTIAAGKTMAIRVEIDNPIHLDFGFIGKLRITYEDDQTLTVPNARIRFIDDSEGSA